MKLSLCFSYSPRFTYRHTMRVCECTMLLTRFDASWARSETSMEVLKRTRNWSSEVWYMWFTRDMSTIAKYNTDPRVATGRYCSRFSLIVACVCYASTSRTDTSFAFFFVSASTWISSRSSRRFPSFSERRCSNRASSWMRLFLFIRTASSTAFS